MANESQQLSDILNKGAQSEQGKGAQAALPGLSLNKILGDVGKELQTQAAHGAHELAAALFNGGSAFVMYPRNSGQREDQQQGQPAAEAAQQPEMQQERSRGGMGR